jgi:hypothetical protein
MGFFDLDRNTLKILLGTYIGYMMGHGNSASCQFLGSIFQRGRIDVDEGQITFPRRQPSRHRPAEAICRTCDDGDPSFIPWHHDLV